MKLSKSIIAFLTISSDAQFGSVEQKRSKKRGALKRFGWKWPLCRDAENFCGKWKSIWTKTNLFQTVAEKSAQDQ